MVWATSHPPSYVGGRIARIKRPTRFTVDAKKRFDSVNVTSKNSQHGGGGRKKWKAPKPRTPAGVSRNTINFLSTGEHRCNNRRRAVIGLRSQVLANLRAARANTFLCGSPGDLPELL